MSDSKFINPAFREIFAGITAVMPQITFYGIIGVYLITAALNVYFIPLPVYLSVPAALAIQFGRFAIVFMDFLNPTGRRSPWPGVIATIATMIAIIELGFSIQEMAWAGAKWWSTFLFGSMAISFGYLLEINFISKGAEAFGMKRRHAGAGQNDQEEAASYPPYKNQQGSNRPLQEVEVAGAPFEFPGVSYNGNGKQH